MNKYICLIVGGLVLNMVSPVWAGEIVAVVNDEPISSYDVEARAKLIAVQRSEYLSDKRKAQYIKEALEDVIDDKVKMKEAQRYRFDVPDTDVNDAIAHLEKQNGLKAGEMGKMLAKNGVPLRILQEQVKADLMWVQVIQRQQRAIAQVTQAEIEKKKDELRAELKKEEFHVFEILVADKSAAEKCYDELQKGVPFDDVVKKYSKAPSAKNGGEVGWIGNSHYGKAVTDVLRQLNTGDLSVPLKTKNGYLLLLLQDKKIPILSDSVPVWELAQLAMSTREAIHFEKQLSALKTCPEFMDFARKYGIPESVKSGAVSPDQLPAELKDILEKQSLNKVIGPVRAQDTDIFFMKCNVTEKKVLPDDDLIKMQIENEKMEALSDKVLKNAKRFSVIEYK